MLKNIGYYICKRNVFLKEIKYLQLNEKSEVPDLVNDINLFIDDFKIKGRISKSLYFDYNICNPILLRKEHFLTKLIIMDVHSKMQHLGLQTTLNHIRKSRFWISKAGQAVKNAISNCITCKKFNAFSFDYPKMTNLPKTRLNLVKPFLHLYRTHLGK